MIETGRIPPPSRYEEEMKRAIEGQANVKADCCAREQTAREVLTEHVEQLELTLRQLRALLAALPMELPPLADRALKRILRPDRF